MATLWGSVSKLDAALSRPIQQLSLPVWAEYLLSWPGGRLFGGSGLIKFTFPALIVLHFTWKRVAPAIAFNLILLATFIAPAKVLFRRQRPPPSLAGALRSIPLRQKVDDEIMSFPSGDSAQSAVIMGILSARSGGSAFWRALMLLHVPLCMFGRAYFICHWFLDTVAGVILGSSCVYFTEAAIGLENVGLHHVLQVTGAGAAIASIFHITGILKFDVHSIKQVLMPGGPASKTKTGK